MKDISLNNKNRVLKKLKGYTYLFLSIILVMIFVFVLAPGIDDLACVKPLIKFIDEREIDAGAIYYTDIEEFSVAEINMKNTLDYSPRFTSGEEGIIKPGLKVVKILRKEAGNGTERGKSLKITSSSKKK